ncbi:MAG: FAD-dependent oxidoreductase [Betaproteobacteria bacterium]|nr:FAD-dependent oxidoreductase [Betaproteobacteria bacterium]
MITSVTTRDCRFQNLSNGEPLDVLMVGGGISGAPLYRRLCGLGYRVALIDKSDFSSGTSQASGMLIWGGLLYLKNFDLLTVIRLCKARKELMKDFPDAISVLNLRYLVSPSSRRTPATVLLGLYAYWFLGGFALKRPTMEKLSPPDHHHPVLGYQEGMLRHSDSRFVIEQIRAHQSEHCIPINYCRLEAAEFSPDQRCWIVLLRDELTGREHSGKARIIINGAGVWTDEVNRLLAVESPYKHVFSKGVYLAFPRRTEQINAHIYPMQSEDDVLSYVPWGPVMMWGPTETAVQDLKSGLNPNREDIRFLLASANQTLSKKIGPQDVVSIRCGIRPLVVGRDYSRNVYPLELSRHHRVVLNKERQAISLYGGKLTSSFMVADYIAKCLRHWVPARFSQPAEFSHPPQMTNHPGLQHDFVTAQWARDYEFCMTLEDYLRRRTTIAQWTPRMGLDRDGSERGSLRKLAETFTQEPAEAEAIVKAYEQQVRDTYDPLLTV